MAEVDILLKATDEASAAINKVNGSMSATQKAGASTALSMTELSSAIGLVERGLGYAKKAFDETVGATVDYANEVRALQQVTGSSAEATSTLIQVLDDYKVSSNSAMLAQRSLTKQGIVLTTESLAKLSEEYLKINGQAEKNAFAQKNLGRSYKDFIEILQQGPAAINAATGAVEKNLIMSEEALKQSRVYEQQIDSLGDSFMAFKVKAGKDALPFVITALDNFTEEINKNGLAAAAFGFGWDDVWRIISEGQQPIDTASASTQDMAASMDDAAASAEEEAANLKLVEDALKAVTSANTGLLSLTMSIQGENDKYKDNLDALNAKQTELQAKLQEVSGDWKSNADDITKAKDALKENADAITALADAHKAAMDRIAFDLFVAKLQADGFTDAEFNIALQAGLTLGILEQATVDEAKAMNQAAIEAQKMADVLMTVPAVQLSDDLNAAAESARRLAGEYVVSIKTIYSSEGTPGPQGGGVIHANAAGGSFVIPQAYGNEGFMMGNNQSASAGETVTVTPRGGESETNALLRQIAAKPALDEGRLARILRDALLQVAR